MNTDSPAPAASAHDTPPRLKPLFRLQWENVQNAYVLLYPEGMVKLNQSAAEILKRCDGTRSLDAVIAELETTFEAIGIGDEVRAFVAQARLRGWLE
ncbi:MAG: pyrroloquinoline quinone biosynthesis peptide chaperone PqqD [Paraburkholderia sp.]|nr:MAG: pyrroloquinoline quinone biosynthesis peptide chaperone PqqD [Paraburkholderia sp.]